MKEYIGGCCQCDKEVYCMDGFLNGVVGDDGALYCFECYTDLHTPPETARREGLPPLDS
ncbi:hypothetical protein J2TS4_05820 [Paenibacillus sp. J2TS4]|nr:hypothetical protein J2TS4_05820 [Paenibacillus sp. J2TS4]